MQDARCIATTVDPVMAQLKALAPLNILFSWVRIPSLSGILSPAKNWALEKPTCRLYPKRYPINNINNPLSMTLPTKLWPLKFNCPMKSHQIPSDPISKAWSNCQGAKIHCRLARLRWEHLWTKGSSTVQLICHLKSNGFSEAFDLSLPEHQLPSKFDHPLRVKSTSPDFSK